MLVLRRSHPINILENTSRYLILLLFPVLRALLTSGDGIYAWLQGAWMDLCILGLILILAIYRWYVYTFYFDKKGIYITKGAIIRQKRYLPFEELTAVSVEAPWYYYPIKTVRLKADTDGGNPRAADFAITTDKDTAEKIIAFSKRKLEIKKGIRRFYIPGNLYIAIFSLLTSNSITGVLYFATSISQAGNLFGKEFEQRIVTGFTKVANILAFGLPPAAAIIGYAVLGFWFLSFVINLLKHLRFEASRQGDSLEVKAGLFTRRRYAIAVNRINYLLIRQSLLSKLFGFFIVMIQCTGYGKAKNEMSVLMPSGEETELKSNLAILLPDIPLIERKIKPKLVNLSRFLIPPLTLIGAVLAVGLLGVHYFPGFRSSMLFLLVIAEIPCVWWLVVKIFSYCFTGIGCDEDTVTLYYTFGYQVITSSIPKEKISKIEISQTLFQISTKCCDVTFYAYAEGRKKQKILNMNLTEVRELLQLSDDVLKLQRPKRFTLWK